MALKLGANQCTGPSFSAQACFMVAGNITTSMERSPLLVSTKAGGPGQWVVYLFRCLWSSKINQLTAAFPSRRFQSFDNGYISSLLDLLKVVGFSTVGLIFFIESMISILKGLIPFLLYSFCVYRQLTPYGGAIKWINWKNLHFNQSIVAQTYTFDTNWKKYGNLDRPHWKRFNKLIFVICNNVIFCFSVTPTCALTAARCIWATFWSNRLPLMSSCTSLALLYNWDSKLLEIK